MNLRQQQQQAFDRSGEPLIVGNVSHCPLPPETLAALGPDSPYVVQVYGSGLTGEVYRLRIAGKEYNLKKRRAVAGVANLNGQLSFLNEVQRRQALQQLKDDPVTARASPTSSQRCMPIIASASCSPPGSTASRYTS